MIEADVVKDDSMQLCEDAIESFMRGNFSRFDRSLEKLEANKTTNIRQLLNQEEMLLMQTEEMDFNERFRTEAASSSALMGVDEDDDENEMPIPQAGKVFKT